MADDRASAAMGRIERALARIDAALARPIQSQGNDIANAELSARHDSLRNETRKALAELEALIGGGA